MAQEFVICIAEIYGRGRIQLKKDIREILHVRDGDSVIFFLNERGQVCIKKQEATNPRSGAKYTKIA